MRKQNKRFAAVMALTLALTMVFSSVGVNAATKKVKSMTLSAKSVTLGINDTKKVTVKKVTPAKASKKVTWKSSNKSVATVSTTGVITAKAKGKATITATSKSNKRVKRTVKVTVKPFEQHYVNAEYVYNNAGNANTVLVDCRAAADYAKGHVPGAVSASQVSVVKEGDMTDGDALENTKKVVDQYGKNKEYLLLCYSGNRYAQACASNLSKCGVANSKIKTLGGDDSQVSSEGGMKAWTKHYPDFVATAGESSGKFFFNNNMTIENVKKDMESGKKLAIIDLRATADYEKGHIAGAVSAPLKDASGNMVSEDDAAAILGKAIKANPNKLYAVCCYSGNKFANLANKAITEKLDKGDKVICITGGYGKWSATEDVVIGNDGLVFNKAAKTVTFKCTVTDKVKEKPAHWFIVNENGKMAGKTLLTTKVTTDDFYDVLKVVTGEKMWNTSDKVSLGSDQSIDDALNKGIGNKDYAKLNLTVSWGGKTYSLPEVITNPVFNGKAYKGDYDIAFGGNIDNQHNAKTGCITCFGGCHMGITSGHDTPMMIEYTPANLPAAGQEVTVTYTVK